MFQTQLYRRATVSCGLMLALAGCAGTPSAPQTPQIHQVAGSYTGRVVYRSATPATHCYAQFFDGLGFGGHAYDATVSLTQTGTTLSGTLTGVHIPSQSQFAGTLSGTAISWTHTGSTQACTTFQDGPCAAERVCVVSHTVDGQWNSGQITGAHRVTWDTFDPDTGVAHGRLEITGTIDVAR